MKGIRRLNDSYCRLLALTPDARTDSLLHGIHDQSENKGPDPRQHGQNGDLARRDRPSHGVRDQSNRPMLTWARLLSVPRRRVSPSRTGDPYPWKRLKVIRNLRCLRGPMRSRRGGIICGSAAVERNDIRTSLKRDTICLCHSSELQSSYVSDSFRRARGRRRFRT